MSTETLSTVEAAARMNISTARLRRLLLDGRIPHVTRTGSRARGEWHITVPLGEAPRRITNG